MFNAWLDPDVASRWLFATATRPIERIEIDARVAGTFRLIERREDGRVEHCGEYVEIVPHRRLVFSLVLADRPRILTRASVEIEPRATGCRLSLMHENVPFDLVSSTEARWTGILYGLGVTLDSFAGERMSIPLTIGHSVAARRLALARRRQPRVPTTPQPKE